MKKTLLVLLLCTVAAVSQQFTTNLQLQLPFHGAQNWDTAVNGNFTLVDTAIGALQAGFQGAWSNATVYSKGQQVTQSGTLYVSLINFNSNNSPGSVPTAWRTVFSSGVTSVALSLPTIFTVTGSPVTGAGTLTAALASQSQNLVLASPSGSSGLPSFRALTVLDIPSAFAQNPLSSDSIQFVSPNGNDSSSGLGWGTTAKLTCAAAVAAVGSSGLSLVIESPRLVSGDCIAGTGSATGVNGLLIAPNRLYIGPAAQATVGPVNQNSGELRLVGSIFNAGAAKDDFYTLKVFENSNAITIGSDLRLDHSSLSGGAGRFFIDTDTIIGNPGDATAGTNFNSFAGDMQGSYFNSGAAHTVLWEYALTVTPTSGGPVTARMNFLPVWPDGVGSNLAEFALGGTGTLGGVGNYSGKPDWLFPVSHADAKTLKFDRATLTADRTVMFPDANSNTVVPNTGGTNLFVTGINSSGVVATAQPAFTNLSGTIAIGQTALTTLGDIGYADAAPSLARLAGNTTVTKKYLSQTGNGSVSAAPAWAQIAAADLSDGNTGTGLLAHQTAPTFVTNITDPLVIGGTGTTSALTLRSTSGVGAAGADIVFQTGSNGATEAMRIFNSGFIGIGQSTPLVPLHLKTTGSGGWPQYETENTAAGGASFWSGVTDTGNGIGGGFYIVNSVNSTSTPDFAINSATRNIRHNVIEKYNNVTTAGNGVAVIAGYATQAGKTTAITTTNLVASTVANNTLYAIQGEVDCDNSSAAATAQITIGWTDISNTAQTSTSGSAVCTTIGGNSRGQIYLTISVKASTAITYSVAIANSPTYDVRIIAMQMGSTN